MTPATTGNGAASGDARPRFSDLVAAAPGTFSMIIWWGKSDPVE
jgi:hypothetical protein